MTSKPHPHIVVIHNAFPSYSHTDIVDQITGLIEHGARITNWALHDPQEPVQDLRLLKYGFHETARYLQAPSISPQEKPEQWLEEFLQINEILDLKDINAFYACSPEHFIMLEPLFSFFEGFVLLGCQEEEIFFRADSLAAGQIRFLFERPNLILTPTEYLKGELIRRGCEVGKVKVHPVGIDFNFFHSNFKRTKSQDVTFLSIGKCLEKNGLEYALSAFASLPYRYNLFYRIIGTGPDEEELKAFADELEIGSQVTFRSLLDRGEILQEIINADVFVLPMVTAANGCKDGISKAILEAQAMGLPVLTTNHGGIPEIVVQGETGLITKEGDIAELTKLMHQLATDVELRQKLSKNARAQIYRLFHLDVLNDTFATYFGMTSIHQPANGTAVDTATLLQAQHLNQLGEQLIAKGDLQGAANAFSEAVKVMPTCAPALNNLGVVHWRAEEPEISLQYFHAALELNANNRTAVVNCAGVLIALGLPYHAKAVYSAYLEMNPYDIEIAKFITQLDLFGEGRDTIITCCEALIQLGFRENAEIAMKSYIERHPLDRDLHEHARKL